MNNLTPKLNEQQLRQNIDVLLSSGKTKAEVQSYVDNYDKGSDGSYVLKGSQQPAEQPQKQGIFSKIGNVAKKIGSALTSSEQAFGQDIAGAATAVLPKSATGADNIAESDRLHSQAIQTALQGLHQAQQNGGDTKKWLNLLSNYTQQPISTVEDLYPALKKTNLQVLGDAGGVLADILSAGSYGEAAKGAKTGELLVKGEKVAQPVVKAGVKQIAKETAFRTGQGLAIGYSGDVLNNAQQGKTLDTGLLKPGIGTIVGGSVPLIIGGVRAGVALTKETAPRFINSLIKPKQADFSYGKDPGRTVSEMGITGNSLKDFEHNITQAKNDVGSQIGDIYKSEKNASIRIDATPDITKIDTAIADAAKGGKNNQGIVTQLQNIKDALLYEHNVNADGVIEKVGVTPRNLENLTPQEAFDLKKEVSGMTQFTGRPSDDKTVNSILKDIYGGLKAKLNDSVGVNNPEITDLNQKYADLTSAELATRNRDVIMRRSDLISNPVKIGTAGALITSIATGGIGIPVVLAGAGAAALDKALESTAVKTRIAAWLGNESPGIIKRTLQNNPSIVPILRQSFPLVVDKFLK